MMIVRMVEDFTYLPKRVVEALRSLSAFFITFTLSCSIQVNVL